MVPIFDCFKKKQNKIKKVEDCIQIKTEELPIINKRSILIKGIKLKPLSK